MNLLSREFSPQFFVQSITSSVNGNNLYPPISEAGGIPHPHIINIHCSAEGLPESSILAKADPVLVMYTKTKRGWKEYGRTEVCYNILNPIWVRPFTYRIKENINDNDENGNENQNNLIGSEIFENENGNKNKNIEKLLKNDIILFKLYDIEENSIELSHHKCIGICEVNVKDLLLSPTRSLKLELFTPKKPKSNKTKNANSDLNSIQKQTDKKSKRFFGYLNIHFFELVSGVHGSLFFRMSVSHIKSPIRKVLKANPFFVISRFHAGSSSFVPVYKSSVRVRKNKVEWDNIEIYLQFVCGGDFNLPIRISFHDYKSNGFKLIGTVSTTFGALIAKRENSFEIVLRKNMNNEIVYDINSTTEGDIDLSLLKEKVNGIFTITRIENARNKTFSNIISANHSNINNENILNICANENNSAVKNNEIVNLGLMPRLFDYRLIGVQISAMIGIDFSSSVVAFTFNNRGNHLENGFFSYRYAINDVCDLLTPLAMGQPISAYAFADFPSIKHRHKVIKSINISNSNDEFSRFENENESISHPIVNTNADINNGENNDELNEDKQRIRSIALDKQTDLIPDTVALISCYEHAKDSSIKHFPQKCYLSPLIIKAREISRKKWAETRSVTVLVVVTNGVFEDLSKAVDLFVESENNKEPFVTIILCMGGKRKELDKVFKHHHGIITDSLGKTTSRRTVKMTTYLEYKVYPDPRLPEKMEPCAKKMVREWLESIEFFRNAPSFQVIENA